MKSAFGKILFIVIAVSIFTGCSQNGPFVARAIDKVDKNRTAWLVYWDLDSGEKDLAKMGNKVGKLSYFGAYFDEFDQIFMPSALSDIKNVHKRKKFHFETYLSFVNDKKNIDGTVVLKDIEVLRRLFSNDDLLDKHVDDIIDMAKKGDFDGIEIDYERIWKDETIGQLFLRFANKLYLRARDNNLKIRIVLEPNTPFSAASFTKGPEYVVMFYNLYGLHSGPGPKANKSFIQKLLAQMESLPGEKSAAFSTGGCVWGSNGKKQLLTELEAKTLSSAYNVVPRRDDDSQNLFFAYENDGVHYQVWYADVKTLNYWSRIAMEKGIYKTSLWRLGGNLDLNKLL